VRSLAHVPYVDLAIMIVRRVTGSSADQIAA
jgi:hypothetical protein